MDEDDLPPPREPWTRTVYFERDGEQVAVTVSNVPPPGVTPRVYWFACPPETHAEAEAIAEHVGDLGQLLHNDLPRAQ